MERSCSKGIDDSYLKRVKGKNRWVKDILDETSRGRRNLSTVDCPTEESVRVVEGQSSLKEN